MKTDAEVISAIILYIIYDVVLHLTGSTNCNVVLFQSITLYAAH